MSLVSALPASPSEGPDPENIFAKDEALLLAERSEQGCRNVEC